MSGPIVIAIDGPSASGKSTNAKIIAAALGYAYVDTGAMYRTLAWHALQQGEDATDAEAVAAHRATPHFQNYIARIGVLAERSAFVLNPVSAT